MFRYYFSFSLFLITLQIQAQESEVFKGYILANDNTPISDVHIYFLTGSKVVSISNTDGSFEISATVLEANTGIYFKHISYKELHLSYSEIIKSDGIIHMQEAVKFLDQITIHPLTAKQMFLTAVTNMTIINNTNYELFASHTTWKANAMITDSIRSQSLLDSLNANILQIPFLDTVNTVVYFDYIKSNAAVFNIENQDDYSFEYVSSDGLTEGYSQIKCTNRSVRGNELLVTISNNDFSILKVRFRYSWSAAPHVLTTDLRYRISSLSGESTYDLKSKTLVSIDANSVVLIGTCDPINQKFKPMISAEKEYHANLSSASK